MMKNENTICSLLGITQNDLAMLLGVSRSQCAMYELGQRDLPLHAKQLLAEILTYIQLEEAAAKSLAPAPRKENLDQLERLLRDNEIQQLLLARKIAKATKKQQTQSRLLLLNTFLHSHHTAKGSTTSIQRTIAGKASPQLEAQFSEELTKLLLRQETLMLEKLVIESRFIRLRSALENTMVN